jgi:hypothetical protein
LRNKLRGTISEALSAVLPITVIVFLLSVFVSPMKSGTLLLFLFGAALLVLGIGLFTMGANIALIPMGEGLGSSLALTRSALLVGVGSFIMGSVFTAAEPDLQVLAQLVPGIPNLMLVLSVAAGVGLFLAAALFRILLRVPLSRTLIVCYIAVAAIAAFAPSNFAAVAFDSGGVTTGPVTVPFIISVGLGLASVRSDGNSSEDSFGILAICSVGPIIAVLILGICYKPEETVYIAPVIPEIITSRDVTVEFIKQLPHYFKEVGRTLWPILALLIFFQAATKRYGKKELARILVGFVYTFAGLVLFMTGVNVGFMPVGQSLGEDMAREAPWLLVPLGALIGYFIVAAEPAVTVLKKQVEEVSGGSITGAAVQRYLSVGVALALAVSMLRVLTGVSIYWFLIPGYVLAIILTFFTPKIFTGIAFDSGGAVSGPMTSTFLLPFALGACGDPARIMTDAFGLVAMVAMTPLIAIQLMGIKCANAAPAPAPAEPAPAADSEDEIIDYNTFDYEEFMMRR